MGRTPGKSTAKIRACPDGCNPPESDCDMYDKEAS